MAAGRITLIAAVTIWLAACAAADGQGASSVVPVRANVAMVETPGAPVMAPASAAQFCRTRPESQMCQMAWRKFKAPVQALVRNYWENFTIAEDGVADRWELMQADLRGDCEDFALTVMNALIGIGVPRSSMALAIVATKRPNYRDHAVLLINTDQGVFVVNSDSRDVLPIGFYYGWSSWVRQPWGGSLAEQWVPFELKRRGGDELVPTLAQPSEADEASPPLRAVDLWGPVPRPRPVRHMTQKSVDPWQAMPKSRKEVLASRAQ